MVRADVQPKPGVIHREGESDARRFWIALALALAVHEIFAGLVPAPRGQTAQDETVARVTIARIEPRRTPAPTPAPHPAVHRHSYVVAAVTPQIASVSAGRSARREPVRHNAAARPRPPVVSHAKPVWDLPVGAHDAGAGTQSGAGSPGESGSGSGTGQSGNGSGAGGGEVPCGYVTFSDVHGSRYDAQSGGFWVDIRMSVHFPDGTSDSLMLDYPFYYASEAASPWSAQNRQNNDIPVLFQPPPAAQRAGEPAIVQYVIAHSDRSGFTLLKDCPSAPSNP